MSATHSSSAKKPYTVARVCRMWEVAKIRCRTPLRWFSDRKSRSNLAIIGHARTQLRPRRLSANLRLPELEARSTGR
jgi:hypothetical protein